MTFDVNKVTEVEQMSIADFGVWKSAKQNEVITLIANNLKTHFLTGLALEAYTDAANTLRKVATMETSNRVLGFSRENKNETAPQPAGEWKKTVLLLVS